MTIVEIYKRVIQSYNENQRRKRSDTATSVFGKSVYRPFSYIPTVLFIKLGFTANCISAGSILVLFSAIYFFIQPNAELNYIGALFYFFFIILDFVDGNIARYSRRATVYGKLLDGFVDSISPIIFTAIGIAHAYSVPSNPFPSIFLSLSISFCFMLNILFRLRLTHLFHTSKLEGLVPDVADGEETFSVKINKSSLSNVIKILRKEAIMLTPVLLMAACLSDRLFEFLLFYALVHCAIGVAEILFYLIKYKIVLMVPTSWARDLWNQSADEFKK